MPFPNRNQFKVLKNGATFYRRIEEAIQEAQRCIDMEHYIFESGQVADRLLERLRERAQQGMRVRILADRLGSRKANKMIFHKVQAAGGEFHWYHPLSWKTLLWFNNRNHRNIIIIDKHLGFTGGAGISDRWLVGEGSTPRWRDTMIEVIGSPVSQLQEAFEDNWREAVQSRSFLTLYASNASIREPMNSILPPFQVIKNRSRQIFQHLIQAAQKSIFITNPYFLPGNTLINAFKRASARGVRIKVLTAGKHADHPIVRWAARTRYTTLLRPYMKLYEYNPTMLHVKTMVVDGTWVVVGTSNFDNRSFVYNDEIDIVAYNRKLAARITCDFEQDLSESYSLDNAAFHSLLYYNPLSQAAARFIELLA